MKEVQWGKHRDRLKGREGCKCRSQKAHITRELIGYKKMEIQRLLGDKVANDTPHIHCTGMHTHPPTPNTHTYIHMHTDIIQWNLRNETTNQAMQWSYFQGGLNSENHNTCIHGFGTKPKRSYF